jgi:glucose/arabinose dehydrogenase
MAPSRFRGRLALSVSIALLACNDPSGPGGIDALQLTLEPVVSGLTAPVFLTAPAGDSRLFVLERIGRIRVVAAGALLPTPFLDITDRVNFIGERGLLGMAFHPQFATNGYFYVYYVNLDGDMVVERFASTAGSNVAGSSAGVVITIPHGGENHHGGTIAFGPDGMLYVAPGDGGCCGDPQNNAQNTGNLLGKILRLDIRTTPYAIPPGNPFIGQVGKREEIWAYGLRNPWRYAFDAQEGMLYIGDVGQDAREEVNVVPAATGGINFGWRLMEGSACYNPPTTSCNASGALELPAAEYVHQEGCSVTGGYVYRGSAIPELTGHYLYADYCRGWLRSFRYTGGGATDHRSWAGIALTQTVSFGQDGAGELYMIAGNGVWRIVRR